MKRKAGVKPEYTFNKLAYFCNISGDTKNIFAYNSEAVKSLAICEVGMVG